MRRSLGIAAAGLAAYAVLAAGVYVADLAPERFAHAWPPPPPVALNGAADRHLAAAAEALASDEDVARRFALSHAETAAAEPLLVRSLALLPAQPRQLARLAAIRWELDPPVDEGAEQSLLRLVDTAGAMAPRVPDVQFTLGDLLLRLGHGDEGAVYLRRALDLAPTRAYEAVKLLHGFGWPAHEIGAALPPSADVLAALYEPAFEDGEGNDYVDRLEPEVAGRLPFLANYYGSACLQTGQAERLAAFAERIGTQTDPESEAARLIQVARADLALHRAADGVAPARRASDLAPSIAWVHEIAGQILLAADRPDEAILMFRRALAAVASLRGWDSYRAAVYTEIGACEERRNHPERAFDEYKRALGWDPKRQDAAAALERIRRATGLKR